MPPPEPTSIGYCAKRSHIRSARNSGRHGAAASRHDIGMPMLRNAALLALFAGTITLATLDLVSAQTAAAPQGAAPSAYRPSLNDLMTATIQPRHIKLGLAGQEQNWPYAAYELGNLRGAFNRTAQAWPTYSTTDMADPIQATI